VIDRASDEEIVALLGACRSARDRLIVLLLARAGLRRGELCGLRRSDIHFLPDSRALGCEVARAHLHVVRRDNPNGAWAKSRRQRAVPVDFLVVQAFDGYEFERLAVPQEASSDFVLVNLFRPPVGAPLRPDGVGELMTAWSRRAGLGRVVTAHQLRTRSGATSPMQAARWTRFRSCSATPHSARRRSTCIPILPGCGRRSSGSPVRG
jgi:integrase/recombinase XerD